MVVICYGRIDWSDAAKRGWKFCILNICTGKWSEDNVKQLQMRKKPVKY